MQRSLAVLLASTVFAVSGVASAHDIVRSERALGGNENPPVVSEGWARLSVQMFPNRIRYWLRYDVASDSSDVTQAHIHIANPGNNGGIAVFLCSNLTPATGSGADGIPACPPSPGRVHGTISMDDVLEVTGEIGGNPVTIIEAGDLEGLKRLIRQSAAYVNVHTDAHPAGEVRGQMNPRRR